MLDNYDYLRVQDIRPIDVEHMNVSKYDRKGGQERGFRNTKERKNGRNFTTTEDNMTDNRKTINRKERTLEEHMNYLIWIGHKNCRFIDV